MSAKTDRAFLREAHIRHEDADDINHERTKARIVTGAMRRLPEPDVSDEAIGRKIGYALEDVKRNARLKDGAMRRLAEPTMELPIEAVLTPFQAVLVQERMIEDLKQERDGEAIRLGALVDRWNMRFWFVLAGWGVTLVAALAWRW